MSGPRNCCCEMVHVRFGLWVFVGSFLVVVGICTLDLKLYMDPLAPILSLQLLKGMKINVLSVFGMQCVQKATSQAGVIQPKKFEPVLKPMCNFSGPKSDFCEIIGDAKIHGNSSSIFFTLPKLPNKPEKSTFNIKLYARKTDRFVMGMAKELSLKSSLSDQEMLKCAVNHTTPAIVFCVGGYASNLFHAFSDVLIPLYVTSIKFNGEVQFLMQNKNAWWVNLHNLMLKALSKYEIVDFDNDKIVRCFKKTTIGLKAHKDFDIDPEMPPYGHTLRNFTQFARRAYNLDRDNAIKIRPNDTKKPKLLVLDRKHTRALLNVNEIAAEARSIGFEVEVMDAKYYIQYFSRIVNSNDVMIGVHGAGLTNMVFLPENAVLINVIPLGLSSVSSIYYQRPAKKINLKYLEYV